MAMPSLEAASAQASVELTSPATTTTSGWTSSSTFSNARQDLGGLHAVRAGADAEEDVDVGEVEIGQDVVGHPAVVVLAGVDDDLVEGLAALERRDDRCHLHEVRPRADNMDDGGSTVREPAARRLGNEDEVGWLHGSH